MAHYVQDSIVVERRLRPIYDAFEVYNNKKALHEAEKVLKKTPTLRCAKALKGLALLRLGKNEESNAIIDHIVAERPCDEATLQVLSFIYKETEQFEKICSIYQNAVEQDGGNEETLTQLFMAYARVGDFIAQQRVAMQLYKAKPKNPYYCWAVMSCVLKALHGPDRDDQMKTKLSLELAQRMMEKFIKEDKLDAEQEVQLYLMILEQQQKYKEELDFLNGPIGTRLYPGAPIELRIKLMQHLGQWAQLNILLKDLLRDNVDRWDYYKNYIESVVNLVKLKENSSDQKVDSTFDLCHDFLCELIEFSNKKFRGPYLGRLELYRVMKKHQYNAPELLGDFLEMLVDYFRVFGAKPCCAKDIILFLDDLTFEQRPVLASSLIQLCEISSTTLPQTKEQMQKHICSLQVSRKCGAHALSTEHLTALYTAFTLHYEHGLNAFGIDMLPTDIGLSDAYALLAVHVMYDLAIQLKSSERLVEALCLLNYLLSNSPSNFNAKLLCMQLYHRIGCTWGAHKTYESINMKFIQLDSMGYLHCARLAISGMTSLAKSVFEPTLKFFTNSYKEGQEYVSMCYKFGSFSKLQEFMDFQNRLAHSFHCSLISVDALLLEIICLSGTFEQNLNSFRFLQIDSDRDNIQWAKISDNRDLSVIVHWDPQHDDSTQLNSNEDCYRQDLEVLRIRSNLLLLIAICVETVTKETYGKHLRMDNTSASNKCELLETQVNNWTDLFNRIRAVNYKVISSGFLVNLLPSRLHGHLSMPYESIFRNLAKLILSLEHRLTEPIEAIFKQLDHDISSACKTVCKAIENHNQAVDLLWDRRSVQEIVALGVEIFSILTFVMTIAYEKYLVSFLNRAVKRSKKKGKGSDSTADAVYIPNDKERTHAIVSLINRLKIDLNSVDAAIESWKTPGLPISLSETLASLSLNPNVETLVNGTIKKNHELTVQDLRNVLKEKLKMLNSLNKINLNA